jgi:hypothetical protein
MKNSSIKALMHFWDPEYRCFSFGNVDMCSPLVEYGLLTRFPRNLFKVYFHQRHDKVLSELAKLMNVPDLYKILDKSVSGLKWKMIEDVF